MILNQRPRPATTRYPITNEAFQTQQQDAEDPAAPVSQAEAKPEAIIVADAPIAAALAAGVPARVPTPTTTFPDISATPWAPPDCTLAAGPDHVLLAVNSSVALYDKMGNAQWEITLDQWCANVVQQHNAFIRLHCIFQMPRAGLL